MKPSNTLLIFIFAITYTIRVCGLALGSPKSHHLHQPRPHSHLNFTSTITRKHHSVQQVPVHQSQRQDPLPEFSSFQSFPKFPAFHTHHRPAHLPQLSHEQHQLAQKSPIVHNKYRDRHNHPQPQLPHEQLQFAQESLLVHNKYRERHGVPPLTLDLQLVHDAYEWAKKDVAECDTANQFVLTHSHRGDRGENIYAEQGTSHMTGRTAVDNWYNEVGLYNWREPGFQSRTSHFSQLVWKDTTTMGMAVAKGKNGFILTVAQYRPPGNFMDPNQFRSNVLPART